MTSFPAKTASNRPFAPFAGHPPGLAILCLVQMWERFSFYGMRALLVLYLTEDLLRPDKTGAILGYHWFEGALTAVFGPLSPQAISSQIYGLYSGLVFLTPLVGGWTADRWLGQRRAVFAGGLLIAAGHVLMAFDTTFLLALLSIILGSGLFTPAISAQVGALYEANDSRRDRAFSLFYLGINLGAMAAPLICGTVGETVGWHAGFSLAALGMGLGLIIYRVGYRWLPRDIRNESVGTTGPTTPFPLIPVLLLMFVSALFWTAYSQSGNVLNFWLRDSTNLTVMGGFELKVTWFQSLNPLFILLGTPLIVAMWSKAAARGRDASTTVKMALGNVYLAAGFAVLAVAAIGLAPGGRTHWVWSVLFIALMTLGELYLAPTSWSLFSRLAPPRKEALLMGLWLLPLFVGGYLSGLVGAWWENVPPARFWLVSAAIAATGALVMFAMQSRMTKLAEK